RLMRRCRKIRDFLGNTLCRNPVTLPTFAPLNRERATVGKPTVAYDLGEGCLISELTPPSGEGGLPLTTAVGALRVATHRSSRFRVVCARQDAWSAAGHVERSGARLPLSVT